MSADRQSLLAEIKALKDEHNKNQEETRHLLEMERQLKRDLQLMEYNRDAENIKANDFKQSLNMEKAKNIELLEKLNHERKSSTSMQDQLADFKEEFNRIKQSLDNETSNYKSVW